MNVNPGDIIAMPETDGRVGLIKLLKIDELKSEDGISEIFHCLMYEPMDRAPKPEEYGDLKVACWHFPIDGEEIRKNGKALFRAPLCDEDMKGFHVYLKNTDFPRYAKEKKQDLEKIIDEARKDYAEGCALDDAGDHESAVEAYTRAIEAFPLFIEALDNRGFAKMDLGDFEGAAADYEQSLHINPENHVAIVSLAECRAKAGDLEEAERVMEIAVQEFPRIKHFRKILKSIRKQRGTSRPWWKIW